jgi:MFS family permease
MLQLAVVLFVREQGYSYADAGLLVAGYTVAVGLAQPGLGRVVDRVGQRRVLMPLAVLFPATVVAVVLAVRAGAGASALLPLAVAMGAALPPVEPCVRAAWPLLAPTPALRTLAYAVEATLRELVFIGGPLVVALVAALASPLAAMLLVAAIGCGGTLWFTKTRAVRAWRAEPYPGRRTRLGALAAPGVRTVMVGSAAMGVAFGVVAVAMPAFGEGHGSRSAGGLALATFALGSLFGGLVAAALPAPRRPGLRYVAALALFAAGLVPLLAAWSIATMLAATMLAGVAIAPAFAAAYGLIDDLAPPSAVTEAFAWMGTAITAGSGLGTALAGLAIEGGGVPLALALALVGGALGAAAAGLRRATLSPA